MNECAHCGKPGAQRQVAPSAFVCNSSCAEYWRFKRMEATPYPTDDIASFMAEQRRYAGGYPMDD
jgi:hypothetical protein